MHVTGNQVPSEDRGILPSSTPIQTLCAASKTPKRLFLRRGCEVPFAAKGQERQPRQRAQAEARWQRRPFRTALYYPHPLHLCIRSTFSHPHRACTRHELCTIIISYGNRDGNRVRSCLSVRRCESVESGRLMAADVWLVGPVGLILGSNGSFGDAWVSLLSLVGTELYTHWGSALNYATLRSVGALWSSMDGLGHNSTLGGTGTDGAKRERYFGETGGGHTDRARRSRVDVTTPPCQVKSRKTLVMNPRHLTHIRFDAKLSRFFVFRFDDFESTAVLCLGASARWRQPQPPFY